MRNGTTLLELLLVLTLLGTLGLWTFSKAAAGRDLLAVHAARESLVGAMRAARGWASLRGGATVEIVTDSALIRVDRPGLDPWILPLGSDHGVTLQSGLGGRVRLRFDRMGIGRFASRSVTILRGPVSRSISISAYGRVQRR